MAITLIAALELSASVSSLWKNFVLPQETNRRICLSAVTAAGESYN
jgi:hypothetical protein